MSVRPRARRLLIAGFAAALTFSGLATVPAAADPGDTQLVSANPQDNTPHVLGPGQVNAIVRVGDTMIVGGLFTQVQEAGAGSPILSRTGLFAFNRTTGAVDPNFNPVIVSSGTKPVEVKTLTVNADGTGVYVGGEYRTINGAGPARFQELKLSDASKVAGFDNGVFNKSVFDSKLVGGRLYVSGAFTNVGGVTRGGLATLDPATGALTTAVTTAFAGTSHGKGTTTVRKFDVTPAGDRLIAIGNFSSVAGSNRMQIAMLDTSGPAATVASWSTTRFPAGCSNSFDTYMHDVDLSPDGTFFVVVTTGGWGGTATTCDSITRFETYRTGAQDYTWIDFTGGDTFWAVEVTGPVAYAGGHFRWLNNAYTHDGNSAGDGAVERQGLVAIDTRNGLPFSWNPGRTRGKGVFDFLTTPTELWAGSDTSWWAGEKRDRLAAFPFAGGKALPNDKLGTVPGDVVQLDSDSQTGVDIRSRYLVSTNTTPITTPLTNGEDWSKARGAVMIGDKVYTPWSDGTFKVRTFDGLNFGAPTNLPLYNNRITSDLSKITSMFYDARDGRLYYTLPGGSGGLYYRYFTPESGIIGAVRYDQLRTTANSLIDASNIRGAFLVGNQLNYVDKNGRLRKITFNPGAFSGTSSLVNDKIDWRAKGLFLSSATSIQVPNTPPTADFTFKCVGLDCTVDGSPSTDSDGTVASYSWDFGDGTGTVTGKTPGHVFSAAGDYVVTLTATDNDGAASTPVQKTLSVAPIPSAISFRTSSTYTGGPFKTHFWTVPADVQEGDTMVMAVTGASTANIADPVGWTRQSDVLDTDTRTVLFTKTAEATDPGSTLQLTWTTDGVTQLATRTAISFAAYSGVASVGPVVGSDEVSTTEVPDHTSPDVTVPDAGDWVVSYWSDKTTTTTGWTAPAGQVVRANSTSLRSGIDAVDTVRVTGLLTDDGAPTVAGLRAGLTAVANSPANKGTKFSVVLVTQ